MGGDQNTNNGNLWIPTDYITSNKKDIGPEKLVYKFPFFNFLFSNQLLAEWPFTKRILVTAFDIYKDDGFVTELSREGITLREYLVDYMGLNRDIAIFADTGIFEFEARKARSDIFDINSNEILPHLSNEEIFDAYDLIDPDFVVAPDEMILYQDTPSQVRTKLDTIEQNLYDTIDRFPKSKIFATIQGIEPSDIEYLLDITKSVGISKIARGGILPLRKESRSTYYDVLKSTEQLARSKGINYLHAFGMASTWSLGDYFVENSYDSLDTSAIYWITARKQFIKPDGRQIPVRRAKQIFDRCLCDGCELMSRSTYYADTSGRFAIGLYFHNSMTFSNIVTRIHTDPVFAAKFRPYSTEDRKEYSVDIDIPDTQEDSLELISAANIIDSRKSEGDADPYHQHRIELQRKITNSERMKSRSHPYRILVLSNCSKRKKQFVPPQTKITSMDHLRDRNHYYEKFYHLALPAKEQYLGSYREIINRSTQRMDKLNHYVVDELIISAGYGIIKPTDNIVPYDSTFNNKTQDQINEMVEILQIKTDLRHHLENKQYDLIISTMSSTYHSVVEDMIIDHCRNYQSEFVWFVKNKDTRIIENLEYFTFGVDEFFKAYKQNKIGIIPGKMWHARANIFAAFVNYLHSNNMDNPLTGKIGFVDFWHKIFDCNCN